MNDKLIDETIITDNYLSFIYSVTQLMDGKRVLLLRNGKQESEPYHQLLTDFERDYIKQIGAHWEIAPLCHLDIYLRPYRYFIQYDQFLISLEDSPFHNLCEIFRKIGTLFDGGRFVSFFEDMMGDEKSVNDFNEKFNVLLLRLTAELFQSKNWSMINYEKLLGHTFTPLRDIFKDIIKHIEKKPVLDEFFYYLNTIFHHNSKNVLEKNDYYLLLIQLISSRFYLDQARLTEDLVELIGNLGGKVLFSKVVDWETFYSDKIKIQLNSFSGIYTTKHITVLDNDPFFKQSYRLIHTESLYVTYRSTFFYPQNIDFECYINMNTFGTTTIGEYNKIIWFIHFFEEHFEINFVLPYRKGTHKSIIKSLLKEFIQGYFSQHFFKLSMVSLISIDTLFTPLVEANQKRVKVLFGENEKTSSELVEYHGALNGPEFGTLSLLNNLTI